MVKYQLFPAASYPKMFIKTASSNVRSSFWVSTEMNSDNFEPTVTINYLLHTTINLFYVNCDTYVTRRDLLKLKQQNHKKYATIFKTAKHIFHNKKHMIYE